MNLEGGTEHLQYSALHYWKPWTNVMNKSKSDTVRNSIYSQSLGLKVKHSWRDESQVPFLPQIDQLTASPLSFFLVPTIQNLKTSQTPDTTVISSCIQDAKIEM